MPRDIPPQHDKQLSTSMPFLAHPHARTAIPSPVPCLLRSLCSLPLHPPIGSAADLAHHNKKSGDNSAPLTNSGTNTELDYEYSKVNTDLKSYVSINIHEMKKQIRLK